MMAENPQLTCQEVVRQYVLKNGEWKTFEKNGLAKQNWQESQTLGHRNAPLCPGCLTLKSESVAYVTETLESSGLMTGYLEKIFTGEAKHYCKINAASDWVIGYLYKKDKKHDHIPIPAPLRASSFVQYPVPMPFHALTFTKTLCGLCRKCGKLWYCDSLQTPNWNSRLKWVMPTSVSKWYTFGSNATPGSGAHGVQFCTKGYKTFTVLTDTWGRQEQWVRAIEEAIEQTTAAGHKVDDELALAVEIDNEAPQSIHHHGGGGGGGGHHQLYSSSRARASSEDVNRRSQPMRLITLAQYYNHPKSSSSTTTASSSTATFSLANKVGLEKTTMDRPDFIMGISKGSNSMRQVSSTSDLRRLTGLQKRVAS